MGNAPSAPPALERCLNEVFASDPGAVFLPNDLLYQAIAVKPYNAAIPVSPAAVVRPTTTEEVAQVVKCAVDSALKIQARSGGHGYGNYCLGGEDGAVVVDLVNFQKFDINRENWHATFGAGTLLSDVTKQLHDAGGRAIAHGTCPQVGIGGHATIGGLGPTSRQWGSTLDHVREVEVVLANSTITRASPTMNQDIFFAMKGAAASFGIITEFIVETHPEPTEVVEYSYNLALGSHAKLANTLSTWQSIISDPNLTRKLATQVIVFELGMIITGTYFGPKSEFDELRFEERLGQDGQVHVAVLNDWLGTVSNWAENEALKLVGGISSPFYSKSLAFKSDNLIPSDGIQALFNFFDTAKKDTAIWFAIFDLEGGAINDIPQDATAYAHRDVLFYMQTYAVGLFGVTSTIREFVNGMNQVVLDSMSRPDLGAYAGYVDPQLSNGQHAYWGENLPRLEALKKAMDPNDVFHNPQSVKRAN